MENVYAICIIGAVVAAVWLLYRLCKPPDPVNRPIMINCPIELFKYKIFGVPCSNTVVPFYDIDTSITRPLQTFIRSFSSEEKTFNVYGMDCEMVSGTSHEGHPVPATVQICNADGHCGIFQIVNLDPFFKRALIQELNCADPPLLVGVGVNNDAIYLAEHHGIYNYNRLDIRFVAESLGLDPKGLDYLGKKFGLKKLKRTGLGPWEERPLKQQNIKYASHDAAVSLDLFLMMNHKLIELEYDLQQYSRWSSETYWNKTLKRWQQYINQHFDYNNRKLTPAIIRRLPHSVILESSGGPLGCGNCYSSSDVAVVEALGICSTCFMQLPL